MTTLARLRKKVQELKCVDLEVAKTNGYYTAEVLCRPGHCFPFGNHSIVETVYLPATPDWQDMIDRLDQEGPVECVDDSCDWCR
jgi:hypothetical protein